MSDRSDYDNDEDYLMSSTSSEDEGPVPPTSDNVSGYGSEGDEYGDPLESSSEEVSSEAEPVTPVKSRARSTSLTSLPSTTRTPAPVPARVALPVAPRPQAARFSFYPGEQKSHAEIVEQATQAARAAFPNDPNPQILGRCVLEKTLYGYSYIPAVEVKLVSIISRMSV